MFQEPEKKTVTQKSNEDLFFKMSTWAVSSEEDVEDFNCNACLQIF